MPFKEDIIVSRASDRALKSPLNSMSEVIVKLPVAASLRHLLNSLIYSFRLSVASLKESVISPISSGYIFSISISRFPCASLADASLTCVIGSENNFATNLENFVATKTASKATRTITAKII